MLISASGATAVSEFSPSSCCSAPWKMESPGAPSATVPQTGLPLSPTG